MGNWVRELQYICSVEYSAVIDVISVDEVQQEGYDTPYVAFPPPVRESKSVTSITRPQ